MDKEENVKENNSALSVKPDEEVHTSNDESLGESSNCANKPLVQYPISESSDSDVNDGVDNQHLNSNVHVTGKTNMEEEDQSCASKMDVDVASNVSQNNVHSSDDVTIAQDSSSCIQENPAMNDKPISGSSPVSCKVEDDPEHITVSSDSSSQQQPHPMDLNDSSELSLQIGQMAVEQTGEASVSLQESECTDQDNVGARAREMLKRKDDSGIDSSRSLITDCSLLENSHDTSRASQDVSLEVAAKESRDMDKDDVPGSSSEHPPDEDKSHGAAGNLSNDSGSDTGDVNVENGHVTTESEGAAELEALMEMEGGRLGASRRKRRHDRSPPSSRDPSDHASSTDTDNEDHDDEPAAKSSSSDNDATEEAVTFPKDKWHPLFELSRRERGYSSRIDATCHLPLQCGGSVNLVRRLNLHCKLDSHQGCVNSLHFNQKG